MKVRGLLSRTRRLGALLVAASVVSAATLSVVMLTSSSAGALATDCGTTSTIHNCIVNGSPSNFESGDGNLSLDAPTSQSDTDWNCFVGQTGFQAGTPPTACKATTGATHVSADSNVTGLSLTGEIQWVNGQKFDTKCPQLSSGNNPPKDEFTDVASYNETDSSNNLFFYGATIRPQVNGNVSGDVEFNQNSASGTSQACRKFGDRLIAYDFLNGGTSLNFHVLTWIDNSDTADGSNTVGGNTASTCFVKTDTVPCWGSHVIIPDSSQFNGEANQSTISGAQNAINGNDLPINAFAEFGINLTQVLGLSQCTPFAQEVWESRSSGSSFTSNPEDIEIESKSLRNCGEIVVIKHTSPTRGVNQDFGYTTTGGLNPSTFTLNDSGNTTSDTLCGTAPCNKQDYTQVPAGPYTVTEDAEPGGWGFGSLTCSTNGAPGTSVTPTSASTTTETASITLGGNGVVTCTYVNDQLTGALKITKTSSKPAGTVLAGAQFTIKDPNGTALAGSPYTTDANGVICVDGLSAAGTYTVQETKAPLGYAIDDATARGELVSANNASCSDTPFTGKSDTFTDTPLTDLSVHVASEVSGGTKSNITCLNGSSANVGNSPQPASIQGQMQFGDPETMTANGLQPGTYTCTVIIDP